MDLPVEQREHLLDDLVTATAAMTSARQRLLNAFSAAVDAGLDDALEVVQVDLLLGGPGRTVSR